MFYGKTFNVPSLDVYGTVRPSPSGSSPDLGAIENSLPSAIPTVVLLTSSMSDGTYKLGDVISIDVTFSEEVTVSGTPQLTLETGSTDAVANYVSGTDSTVLTFSYTVSEGDSSSDLDYNSISSLSLNNGAIKDSDSSSAVLTLPVKGSVNSLSANKAFVVDGFLPTVVSVSSNSPDSTYAMNDQITIQVTFSEVVIVTGTPQLTLETGSTDAVVNYSSGSGGTTINFTYTVAAGHAASDLDYDSTTALVLNSGTINDAAGNTATLTLASPGVANSLGANKALVVDGIVPTVLSVSSNSANGYYNEGDTLMFTVTFSEPITVTGTPPKLTLETGITDGLADYYSGSADTTLVFRYIVANGDSSTDLDYTDTTALVLNNGSIADAAGNAATLTLASPAAVNSLGANKTLIIDTAVPVITAVTSTTPDGSYNAGDTITINVIYSESVNVTGTPQLTLETGTVNAVIDYSSSTGDTIMTFSYIVTSEHETNDLDYVNTTALNLNNGTILDYAGNVANLTLVQPGAANSISFSKGLIIDNVAPTITSASEGSAISTSESDLDYLGIADTLIVSWAASDSGSGIAMHEYDVGVTLGGIQIKPWTSTGTATADTLIFPIYQPLIEGATYFLSVRSTDVAGNLSSAFNGDGIYIDLTNPVAGNAFDGVNTDISYTGSDSTLTVTWLGFNDTHSGVASYKAAIEDAAGQTVLDWTDVGNVSTWTATGLSLSSATMYHVLIRAADGSGNFSTTVSTDGIIIDTDGPISVSYTHLRAHET